MTTTKDFQPITTEDGTKYEPWTDGYAVGFRCTKPSGEVSFVYLNPSEHGEDVPNVFVYEGPAGDPCEDEPSIHICL